MLYTFNYVLNYANFYINTLIKILELSLYVYTYNSERCRFQGDRGLGGWEDYNRYSSNLNLTARACGQCTCVDPKYHPLVFGSNASLLMLLQH